MNRAAKIGLFIIIVGVAGGYFVIRSGDGFRDGNTYEVSITMEDASGLSVGSEIFMAGVPIGIIEAIQLSEGRAQVTLAVADEVDLYQDATAVKEASSLLGTSIIELDPGGQGGALSQGGTIHNVRVRGEVADTIEQAEDAGAEITALVEELRRQHLVLLESSLQAIDNVAQRIDRRSVEYLAEVSVILSEVADTVERVSMLVDRRDEDVDEAVLAMRRSVEDIEDITSQISAGEGNVGKAVYDDELYNRVVSVAEETEALVRQIRGLRVQVGFESTYLTEPAASVNQFALRLLPRSENGYCEVGIVDTPDGVTEEETDRESVTSGGSTTTTVTERTTTSQQVKFNALIARHFGPVTLRGGVIQNSGGVGLDLRPIDQLMISGEMFSFGGDEPNLRAGTTIFPLYQPDRNRPWYWLYLTGGVADILDTDGWTPYFGGGLRFTDEDIRGLVGLIPLGG